MFYTWLFSSHQLPKWLNGKESAHQYRRHRFYPWVRKIPWRGKWQSTPVFLPGKSHQQGSLEGSSMRLQRAGHDWACTNAHSVMAIHLLKRLIFSPWCMLASSCVINWLVTTVWVYCWGLYSDLLIHESVFVSVPWSSEYHTLVLRVQSEISDPHDSSFVVVVSPGSLWQFWVSCSFKWILGFSTSVRIIMSILIQRASKL